MGDVFIKGCCHSISISFFLRQRSEPTGTRPTGDGCLRKASPSQKRSQDCGSGASSVPAPLKTAYSSLVLPFSYRIPHLSSTSALTNCHRLNPSTHHLTPTAIVLLMLPLRDIARTGANHNVYTFSPPFSAPSAHCRSSYLHYEVQHGSPCHSTVPCPTVHPLHPARRSGTSISRPLVPVMTHRTQSHSTPQAADRDQATEAVGGSSSLPECAGVRDSLANTSQARGTRDGHIGSC